MNFFKKNNIVPAIITVFLTISFLIPNISYALTRQETAERLQQLKTRNDAAIDSLQAQKDRLGQAWGAKKDLLYGSNSPCWGVNYGRVDDGPGITSACSKLNREEKEAKQAFDTSLHSLDRMYANARQLDEEIKQNTESGKELTDEQAQNLDDMVAKNENSAGKDFTQEVGKSWGSDQIKGSCNVLSGFDPAYCITYIFAWVAYAILSLCSWILGLSGLLFDNVLSYTVVQMAARVSELTVIGQMWVLLRDIVNITFIFILLYIAIRTILSINDTDTKKFIRNVIIAAILVNFSLFFTKVIIDASNIMAIGFYKQTVPVESTSLDAESFSKKFVRPLGITAIFDAGEGSAFVDRLAVSGFWHVVIMGVGGSIFIILIAFTFLYATVLFLIRYVALIFLMIFSGIAFLSFVLPATKKYGEQWRQALIGQAVFAPLYLFMIYFVVRINEQLFSGASAGLAFNEALNPSTKNLSTLGNQVTNPIIKFLIIIGLLNVATHLAKSFASQGSKLAEGAVKWGSGKVDGLRTTVQTAALRNTVGKAGRAAGKLYDKGEAAMNNSAAGRLVMGASNFATLGAAGAVNRSARAALKSAEDIKTEGGMNLADMDKYYKGRKSQLSDLTRRNTQKSVISAGVGITNSRDAKVEAMQKEIGQMSDKDIEELDFATLSDVHVASALSTRHLQAIDKSDKFTDSQKASIKKVRFGKIDSALVNNIDPDDATRRALKGMDADEIEMLGSNVLTNPTFVAALNSKQYDAIMSSKRFTPQQKEKIAEIRVRKLQSAVASGVSADILREMLALGPKGVAKLDRSTLGNPSIIRNLSNGMLKEIAEEKIGDPTLLSGIYSELKRVGFGDPTATPPVPPIDPSNKGWKYLSDPNNPVASMFK